MKLLVCGGRDFNDRDFLFKSLDQLHAEHHFSLLIHGGAKGADKLAGEWAADRGIEFKIFPADWDQYGRSAGMIRNRQMLNQKPDLVVAFSGGRGTQNMINISEAAGVNVICPRNK